MRLIAGFATLLFAASCTEEPDAPPPPDTVPIEDGLTIFTSSADSGLSGAYREGEHIVFFETIREVTESPAPQHDIFDFDGTAIDVSARYVDMEGRNLMVAISSHLQPLHWAAGHPSDAMLAQRPHLFPLVEKAGAALEAANFSDTVEAERGVLVSVAKNMRPPSVPWPELEAPDGVALSGGWDHWQYFEVHSAACCGIAEHSATVFWNFSYSGGGWEGGWQTNNHGRWAMEMGLEGDCGGSGVWAGNGDRGHKEGWHLQSCTSSYSACGVFGADNHNCHDDSKIQRANIVCETWYDVDNGICDNYGCDSYAPGCGGCGGI